jgi:hypothetical protein
MTRTTFYVLTVHFYPHAIKQNVEPVEVIAYTDVETPGRYRSHDFNFDHPPTPEDFKAQHAWNNSLIPALDINQWPYIGLGKKAASTEVIVQDYGVDKKIGHLEVRKNDFYKNDQYPSNIYVPHQLVDYLTKGYKGEARQELRQCIDSNELRIIGNVVKLSKDNKSAWPSEETIAVEIRKIIKEWKKNRKPQPA